MWEIVTNFVAFLENLNFNDLNFFSKDKSKLVKIVTKAF